MTRRNMYKLFLFTIIVKVVEGVNILVVFPHEGKSHFMAFQGLFEELAKRGHNLTVISAFPKKTPIPNWRDVSILEERDHSELIDFSVLTGTKWDRVDNQWMLARVAERTCKSGMKNENFQNFLKENNEFDLILMEVFNTNCFMGLAKIYQAPVIGMLSAVPMPWAPLWFGSPINPSYIPNQNLGFSDRMTFLERVANSLFFVFMKVTYDYLMAKPGNDFSKRFTGQDVLDNGDIMYNMSLMFTNSHFSLNLPKPLVPSIIEIGGIHLEKPKKLPDHIAKFINESASGVVYMSLGSTLRSDSMTTEKKSAFMRAFSRLKQRVILKWESDIEDKPANVLILRWAPQLDILCDPNVKAFISHGGMGGLMEAVHCGVPVITVPQLGDQHLNAKALEASGGGVILDLKSITETVLVEALNKVLSSEMEQSMKSLSARFNDRPLSPMDTAIYWIEYVVRHKGAFFMRTAAVDMPWYQQLLLDVIGFLVLIVVLVAYVFYRISSSVFNKLFKQQIKVKKS
ncbi:UDP-glycosyltransferase UGT5 isoform X1 [Leptinotarsa decemlineata]|uniref:UDP-glycosyltransferase UGT5 isoform X1 n=1 Tax=Leptinotarsa decemlineata TaxID=7539 RepID=UPI003D30D599